MNPDPEIRETSSPSHDLLMLAEESPESVADYVGRVKHYLPFEMVVVPELKNTKALTEAQQKEKEGELLLRCLQPGQGSSWLGDSIRDRPAYGQTHRDDESSDRSRVPIGRAATPETGTIRTGT